MTAIEATITLWPLSWVILCVPAFFRHGSPNDAGLVVFYTATFGAIWIAFRMAGFA